MLVVNRYGRKNAYFIHPSSLVPFCSFFGENKSKERGDKIPISRNIACSKMRRENFFFLSYDLIARRYFFLEKRKIKKIKKMKRNEKIKNLKHYSLSPNYFHIVLGRRKRSVRMHVVGETSGVFEEEKRTTGRQMVDREGEENGDLGV